METCSKDKLLGKNQLKSSHKWSERLKPKVKKTLSLMSKQKDKNKLKVSSEIRPTFCIEEISMCFWHQWQKRLWTWEKR
jgi:hypothetical protein